MNSRNFCPSEIYQEVSKHIDRDFPCLFVGDDTLISKQYSKKIDLVHYQYSGAVHEVIPGIGMVNLLHYDNKTDQSIPVDYIGFIIKKPTEILMDAWCSSLENLKHIRNLGWTWVTNLTRVAN